MSDELIEVWRKSFEVWFNLNHGFHRFYSRCDDGKYQHQEVEQCWQSWLAAKRSQPVIELPEENFIIGSYGQVDAIYFCNEIKQAITAAGYQYKVRE